MTPGSWRSKEFGANPAQQGEVPHLCALRSMILSVAGFAELLVGASETPNPDRLLNNTFGHVDIRCCGAEDMLRSTTVARKQSRLHCEPLTYEEDLRPTRHRYTPDFILADAHAKEHSCPRIP